MSDLIHQCAEWLAETAIAQAIAGSGYMFPMLETVHVIGLTLVIGTIGIVDLRLLGLASTKRPIRDVCEHMLPLSWTGFLIALISGALMFMANATSYVDNRAFQLKFLFLFLAGVNMLVFHTSAWRSLAQWNNAEKPPAPARIAGAISLSCWIVIVFLGRWIGFLV